MRWRPASAPRCDAGGRPTRIGSRRTTSSSIARPSACTVDDRELHLTRTEWLILDLLVAHEGRPLSNQEILHAVWGPNYEHETDYVRVFVAALRRKLEPEPAAPRYITTRRGLGYRFSRRPVVSSTSILTASRKQAPHAHHHHPHHPNPTQHHEGAIAGSDR